jgi:hypothetical protein
LPASKKSISRYKGGGVHLLLDVTLKSLIRRLREGKMKKPKKKRKENVREYDPEKDGARLIIGAYSSYLKKRNVVAQNDI